MVELHLPQTPHSHLFMDEVIDVHELVNYRTLRAKGVRAEEVKVYYQPDVPGAFMSLTEEGEFEIVVGREIKELVERHPEYAYLLFAHELTHATQPDPEEDPKFRTSIRGRPTMVHARLVSEQEAVFWEAQQAAKFGWSREEYEQFVQRLAFAAPYSHQYMAHMKIEMRERPYAALPALTRRPSAPAQPSGISSRDVRVREHRRAIRRRVVDHLEHPPSYCMCHRSKTVDGVRRGMIRRLK